MARIMEGMRIMVAMDTMVEVVTGATVVIEMTIEGVISGAPRVAKMLAKATETDRIEVMVVESMESIAAKATMILRMIVHAEHTTQNIGSIGECVLDRTETFKDARIDAVVRRPLPAARLGRRGAPA